MKLISLFFVVLLTPGLWAAVLFPSQDVPVRVRLSGGNQEIRLQGLGFQIFGKTHFADKVALPTVQNLLIQRTLVQRRPVWKVTRSSMIGKDQIEIFTEKFLAIKAIEVHQASKSLPSQILLSARGPGTFDVIGILPLENYLVGVIASEMPLSWPLETLKAQAIAARSYALATMRERAKQVYHLESSVLDQVFTHVSDRVDDSPRVVKAKLAVEQTWGQVLMTPQHKVLKAFYHSDCGGKTANPLKVWGAGPASGEATDDSCPHNPQASWNLQISVTELSRKIQQFLRLPELLPVSGLSLLRGGAQERVEKVEVIFTNGERRRIWAHELRTALGYDQLRSTLFSMTSTPEGFQFQGQGFGHGVGLCQWGARALGRLGQSSQEILEHYYPQALLSGASLPVSRNSRGPETQTR